MAQAEEVDVAEIVSISSVISLCFIELNALLELAHKQHDENSKPIVDTIQDELGRLRLWAGNFGAHRKPTDRLSLDHRLREAQELHKEVRKHLYDIRQSAQNARDIISPLVKPAEDEDKISVISDDSDSDSFWAELREDGEFSEMDELLLDIGHAITSLYKFSITLQNPAHRDRSKQAARINMSHYSAFDIQHASDKFGLPKEDSLIQRLGKANTTRRQILAYHKDHSRKISKYIDVAVDKAIMLSHDFDNGAVSDKEASLKQPDSNKLKSVKTASTQWTQNTTVSTIRLTDIENISDSGRTKFSSASSTNNNQHQALTIPPPPDPKNAAKGVPFICPYCVQLIQLANIEDDWHYHVYSDLRPYVCTFPNCRQETRLFDSYTEWSDHEWQFHRREWACHICPIICDNQLSFTGHLQETHPGLIPGEQLQTIVRLSSRPVTSPQKCPLCMKPPVAARSRFQQHLARHLQQLSLFILPRIGDGEDDQDIGSNQNVAGNDSQKALLSDDGGRSTAGTRSTTKSNHILGISGESSGHEFDGEDSTGEIWDESGSEDGLPAIRHDFVNPNEIWNTKPPILSEDAIAATMKDDQPLYQATDNSSGRETADLKIDHNRLNQASLPTEDLKDPASSMNINLSNAPSDMSARPGTDRKDSVKQERFQCVICSNKHLYRDRGSFRRHVVDVHQAPENYVCALCPDLRTGRRDKARLHLAQRHGLFEPSKDDLNRMATSASGPYECEACHIQYNSWEWYFECIREHCHVTSPSSQAGSSQDEDDDSGNYNRNDGGIVQLDVNDDAQMPGRPIGKPFMIKMADARAAYYEGWRLTKSDLSPGQKPVWYKARIVKDQLDLLNLVQEGAKGGSSIDQHRQLPIMERIVVDDLIEELFHTQSHYEWTCVYVKEEKGPGREDSEVLAMDVVLMRTPAREPSGRRESFNCLICSVSHRFRDRGSFRRHFVGFHQSPTIYTCRFCDSLSSGRRDRARQHLYHAHGRTSPTKGEIDAMERVVEPPFICDICRIAHITWDQYFECIRGHCSVDHEPGEDDFDQHDEVDDSDPGSNSALPLTAVGGVPIPQRSPVMGQDEECEISKSLDRYMPGVKGSNQRYT